MARIQGAILLERPPEVVFDFIADERNEPSYNPRLHQVDKLSSGPVGPGTRYSAVATSMGRRSRLTVEFTEYQRPRRLASSTRMAAMDIDGALTFMDVDGATWMRWSWTVRPHGAVRLLGPLLRVMGARQERAIWTALKHLLEGQTPTAKAQPAVGPAKAQRLQPAGA